MIEQFSTSIEINESSIVVDGVDYKKFGGKLEYLNQNIDGSYNLQISFPLYAELEFLAPNIYTKRFPIYCDSNDEKLNKIGTYYLTIEHIELDK